MADKERSHPDGDPNLQVQKISRNVKKSPNMSQNDSSSSVGNGKRRNGGEGSMRKRSLTLALPLTLSSLLQLKKELNVSRRGSRCTTRKTMISSTSPTLPRCHSPILHYSPGVALRQIQNNRNLTC
ncbi:microtubule-associated serine/threonine-protein kinase 2-like [Limulus polyphemus]|uniref:Microtubule-associated serine/threonine-protein kinase 2-like n=1 Tax=Limulus polyphemus TaxID=6850 RepID=A0ABM1RWG2_LIMPO|nr:microtubule-associated serine/threonine-protein kinase 2-like [Limulus polyphemus]